MGFLVFGIVIINFFGLVVFSLDGLVFLFIVIGIILIFFLFKGLVVFLIFDKFDLDCLLVMMINIFYVLGFVEVDLNIVLVLFKVEMILGLLFFLGSFWINCISLFGVEMLLLKFSLILVLLLNRIIE